MTADTRTIHLDALIKLRDEIYHASALCEALHHAMENVAVANGLPELLQTINNTLDAAGESVHILTFPEKAERVAA
jgi:histidinol-phosphate/aromatic aminotransferase/cobyric acid decarboxylase-like protein